MSEAPFFDLKATHNPHRWYLPVEMALCVGRPGQQFLYGGAGLAASIRALEGTTGRPTIWATAQYLDYARPGTIVDLDVLVPVSGHYTSQARVVGHVRDKEIITVNAALGSRPSSLSHQWAKVPDVPRPEDCEPLAYIWERDPGDLYSYFDVRVVKGRHAIVKGQTGEVSKDGNVVLWIRPAKGQPVDSALLAMAADFVPLAVGDAIGRAVMANSLDNTIRFRCVVPTEWVLCDIRIHSVHGGFAHGRMHLFAEDGTLMATASQSVIIRLAEDRWGK
ncbi:acyl-CoA thioesterase [Pedomonas mirosovicensis]|uniref:acyl-CoA thioesterase n=1 Tax=Pedomonas mirosovicensis TaxID=2908641 RepID=UPI0021687EBC|nr:acyl-CoA thioesterase domain-containing protein [Pedomonas mirosovicensis]MCH8684769.1 thioesterase family protein [Pedomonas mirosovicensis]